MSPTQRTLIPVFFSKRTTPLYQEFPHARSFVLPVAMTATFIGAAAAGARVLLCETEAATSASAASSASAAPSFGVREVMPILLCSRLERLGGIGGRPSGPR